MKNEIITANAAMTRKIDIPMSPKFGAQSSAVTFSVDSDINTKNSVKLIIIFLM